MSTVELERGQGSVPPKDPGDITGGDGHGHDGHDHLPHLPPPSIRPLIMGVGLLILGYGLAYFPHANSSLIGFVLLFLGLLTFGIGLGGWIYDDIQEARRQNAAGGHGHH
jgi:hypothetical protein